MVMFFSVLTGLGAICGALVLLGTFATSQSAPQEAAGAAMAVALAVIPYVLFRITQISAAESKAQERHAQLVALLEDKTAKEST